MSEGFAAAFLALHSSMGAESTARRIAENNARVSNRASGFHAFGPQGPQGPQGAQCASGRFTNISDPRECNRAYPDGSPMYNVKPDGSLEQRPNPRYGPQGVGPFGAQVHHGAIGVQQFPDVTGLQSMPRYGVQ